MLHKNWLSLFLIAATIIFSSGCSVNRATATLDPSADLAGIKTIYVNKFAPDGRGINLLITNKLKSMGYSVKTGIDAPKDVDVIVTYEDKWMWDLTMYMIELTITIRDPDSNFPLASGNSYHTSLTRKSPEEMVEEVVNNIFKQGAHNEKG